MREYEFDRRFGVGETVACLPVLSLSRRGGGVPIAAGSAAVASVSGAGAVATVGPRDLLLDERRQFLFVFGDPVPQDGNDEDVAILLLSTQDVAQQIRRRSLPLE